MATERRAIISGFSLSGFCPACDLGFHPLTLLGDIAMTFVSIYALGAPIGAILTTYVLLEKRDLVVWLLTGIALTAED